MITITIPTKGRRKRIKQCIESIDKDCFIKVCAVEGGDVDLLALHNNLSIYFSDKSIIYIQNWLSRMSHPETHLLPASDDIAFMPDSIKIAEKTLWEKFPDTDGVIGFNICNMKEKDKSIYAFMLIGNKFLRNRLLRKPFYEEYQHFYADTETGMFADKLGKFFYCEEAKIEHYHPCTGVPADKTHLENRNNKWLSDNQIFTERQRNVFIREHQIFPHLSNT